MRIFIILLVGLAMLCTAYASAAESVQKVKVTEPFIHIYTGPGRGYPIKLDLARGHWLTVIKQQADWYKVLTDQGEEGWVNEAELEKTVTSDGNPTKLQDISQADFSQRDWEIGTLWGDAEGADVFSLYGAYAFNANLSTELSVSQMIGSLSISTLININLVAHPFPEWRVSPFFTLGTGTIKTKTRSSLVRQKDQEDNTSHVGIGVRAYLTRSFFLRAEYKEYVIFSSSNDNEEIAIWSVGVGSFFKDVWVAACWHAYYP